MGWSYFKISFEYKWRKKQYLAKVMNNWAFVGKTKNIALKKEEKYSKKKY